MVKIRWLSHFIGCAVLIPVTASAAPSGLDRSPLTNQDAKPALASAERATLAAIAESGSTSSVSAIANVMAPGSRAATPDSQAFLHAYESATIPIVNVPYRGTGYRIDIIASQRSTLLDKKGRLRNENQGITFLNGNAFTGAGLGDPSHGDGTFVSTYTNPWNVTTNLKMEFDPAAIPESGDHVTNQGLSIECLPNHPNSKDGSPTHHWVACVYRGASTGTGGYPESSINTEVGNDVLNLETNSGTADEIDVNVNGRVSDGRISRGLFITGGGVRGLPFRSVALDIQHGAYSGAAIPWSTGLSIRNAFNSIELYKESTTSSGAFLSTFDEHGHINARLDKNGIATLSGMINTNRSSESIFSRCIPGEMHADDNMLYVCVSSHHYKMVRLQDIQ